MVLEARPDLTLYMIDPWQTGSPGDSWWASSSRMPRLPQSDYDAARARVLRMARRHGERAIVMHAPSLEAVEHFSDGTLDLVFIDADHSYDGCLADIDAWRPKVKAGGILSGHDFDGPRFPGVREAVEERFGDGYETGEDETWFVVV
jgi:Methyltransferase domain